MKTINTEICDRYGVSAEPSNDGSGFVGIYEIPGKDKQLARDADGGVAVFDSEDEAVAVAGEDLCEALNARTMSSRNFLNFKVMGGAELAVALKRLNVSPASFSLFCGTPQDKIMKWIDGVEPIPRTVNMIAHLLTLPGAVESAEQLVATITSYKPGKSPEERRAAGVAAARRAV